MNERINELAEQARDWGYAEHSGYTAQLLFEQKFAELIVRECIRVAMDELVLKEDIDTITDIEDRCYLQGNNTGVVDAVVSIKQYFGVEE